MSVLVGTRKGLFTVDRTGRTGSAGNAGYGILFGTVFTGLAIGMLIGPKVFPTIPRRMIFTPAIGAAGISLVVMSVLQDFLGAAITAFVMGVFAGVAK